MFLPLAMQGFPIKAPRPCIEQTRRRCKAEGAAAGAGVPPHGGFAPCRAASRGVMKLSQVETQPQSSDATGPRKSWKQGGARPAGFCSQPVISQQEQEPKKNTQNVQVEARMLSSKLGGGLKDRACVSGSPPLQ